MSKAVQYKLKLSKASDITKLYKSKVNNYRYIQIDSSELSQWLIPFASPLGVSGPNTKRQQALFVEEAAKKPVKFLKIVLKELHFM